MNELLKTLRLKNLIMFYKLDQFSILGNLLNNNETVKPTLKSEQIYSKTDLWDALLWTAPLA
jgi:hypothetical protein